MVKFLELYERYALEGIGIALILLFVFMGVVIHKLNKMNKQMNRVIEKVVTYVDSILEEEEPLENQTNFEETPAISKSEENTRDVAQNRLINAVLEEIFP